MKQKAANATTEAPAIVEPVDAEELDAYARTNNPPPEDIADIIADHDFLGSEYNREVGRAAEEETWRRYLGNRLLRDWQQPFDGIIPLQNGRKFEWTEDMRQVQVKTRTWEKKSGGSNHYDITLPSHEQMASDGFYHFWVHTVPERPRPVDDGLVQYDLEWNPVEAEGDERPLTYEQIRDAMTFHADVVFGWRDIDALITYAQGRHDDADDGVTGISISTDSYDNDRMGFQVPLMFEYKDALETAQDVYVDDERARQHALRRIDGGAGAREELGRVTFYG